MKWPFQWRLWPTPRRWFLGITCLMMTLHCLALDPTRTGDQYQFSQWNTTHGIPYTAVRHLFQSSQGFIWLSTRGGVARFDGVSFQAYTVENTPGIISDEIWCVSEDHSGTLWIGTAKGVLWHRNSRWWPPKELEELNGKDVRWLQRDGERMFIGTTSKLYVWEHAKLSALSLPENVEFYDLHTVSISADRGWIIAAQPSWLVTGSTAVVLKDEKDTLLKEMWCATPDKAEGWLLGSETGLYRLHGGTTERLKEINGVPIGSIRSLLVDKNHTLWLGTRGDLLRITKDTTIPIERAGVDSLANFLCLLEDNEGGLWGGNDSGLIRLGDVKAINMTRSEGLKARSVVSVLCAKDGRLWAAVNGGGLSEFTSDGRVVHTILPPELPSDAAWNLAEGPDGTLWIGYYNKGISRYRNGKHEWMDSPIWLGPRIRSLAVDRTGTVWISSWENGLVRLQDDLFSKIEIPSVKVPNALLVDSQDNLWVSWDNGFGRVDKKTGALVEKHEFKDIPARNAIVMLEGPDHEIWIFREELMIERLSKGRLDHFFMPASVGRLTYSALIKDGELWCCFRNGIARIPIGEFDEMANGRKASPDYEFYNEIGGLRGVAPNIYGGHGADLTRDGKILFATSKGVVIFDPKRTPKITTAPTVLISRIIVDKQSYDPADLGSLRPGRGELAFQYTAMGLGNAPQNQFRHRLLPVDKTWVEDGPRREANYGGLSPGKYRFEVLACNADRVWSTTPAVCEFTIPPHFHQTLWFYLIVAVSATLLVWGYVQWHEVGLRREKLQLECGVRARTKELNEANQRLSRQMEETQRKASELQASEERYRRLNEELEQRVRERTGELEAANRELESFSYSVSHDLRAPLRGIDGWSLALMEDYGPALDATARKYLERVRKETQRLGLLIDDLLKLSRMTRAELHLRPIDLSALVERTAAHVVELRPGSRVDFHCRKGLQCKGDPTLLEAALFNLLDNAWKFSDRSAAPRVDFEMTLEDGHPVYHVSDNGAGFDMRHAQKLFGVFQRMHTQEEFPGTGVGLATVQRIIQRHGGRIWAESEPGVRTTFHFTLPNEPQSANKET